MANFLDFGDLVSDNAEVDQLKSIVFDLAIDPSMRASYVIDRNTVPVMTPSTLSRRDVAALRKRPHWVAEKSDGERCLLLSFEGFSYLVDMKFSFFKVNPERFRLPSRSHALTTQNKTMLDCMMVWNHAYGKYSLMVLDVYVVEGERKTNTYFQSRVDDIRELIIVPIRKVYPTDVTMVRADLSLPFIVQSKEYWHIDSIQTVFSRIQHYEDEGKHRFVYQNDKRYNENDGLVFVPDETLLHPSVGSDIKKWKFHSRNSIIFNVEVSEEVRLDGRPSKMLFKAFVNSGLGHSLYYRDLFLRREDSDRLVAACKENHDHWNSREAFRFPYIATAEFFFDRQRGEWRYVRFRPEAVPSSFSQAMQQLEATAENVTKEEILHSLNLIAPLARVSSNPATPATPSLPFGASPDTDTSPTPPFHTDSSVGAKRKITEIYGSDPDLFPSIETKRQRLTDPSDRPL